MKDRPSTIQENRALTPAESHFIEWLLRNGGARSEPLVPQLSRAWVTGRCSCDCASINLSIDGMSHYGEDQLWDRYCGPVNVRKWPTTAHANGNFRLRPCGNAQRLHPMRLDQISAAEPRAR